MEDAHVPYKQVNATTKLIKRCCFLRAMRSGRALDERVERTQERRNPGAAQPVVFHSQHAQVAYPTLLPRTSRLRVNRSANLSTNVPDGPMDSRSGKGIQ